jgi:putative hemolysin
MEYRQCITGILIWLFVIIIASFLIYTLECLKKYKSDSNDSNDDKLVEIAEDKMMITEREAIIKIFTATVETAISAYFFGGFLNKSISSVINIPMNKINIITFVIISIFTLIFISSWCNMLPRKLAYKKERHSHLTYMVSLMTYHMVYPLWIVQYGIGTLTSFLFGAKSKDDREKVTEEKILQMVDEGNESGVIKESQREMINNIFDFDETLVSDVMTHRKDMVAVSEDMNLSETIRLASKEGYSRIPVYSGNIDKIVGVVYVKDLLSIAGDNKNQDVQAKKFMRSVMFVPETAKCSDVLRTMLKNKTQLAIVADEYGGTFGVVCMEDLIEEIIGNIQDEYDNEEAEINKIDTNTYIIMGDARIEDVFSELEIKMPDEDKYDTMSGFVVDLLGYVPENNTNPSVVYENVRIDVLDVRDNWIEKIRLNINTNDDVVVSD